MFIDRAPVNEKNSASMLRNDDNLYESGLNRADWYALRGLVDPHYSFRDGKFVPPGEIKLAPLPPHLVDHPVTKLVNRYRATGNSDFLDQAGQLLVPDNELWWLIIGKS